MRITVMCAVSSADKFEMNYPEEEGSMSFESFESRFTGDDDLQSRLKAFYTKFMYKPRDLNQFDDGDSLAGCYVEFKDSKTNKIRTFAICTKESCNSYVKSKFTGRMKKVVSFEVRDKKGLFDGRPVILDKPSTANTVDTLVSEMVDLVLHTYDTDI